MAEPPASPPDYIFPFMTAALSSNVNLFDFTYLMYRPLYWIGEGTQPVFNSSLSLASAPVFSGRNVTINLKHGWTVVPGGTTTCADPAKCGPGIAKGKALTFNFPYATGLGWLASVVEAFQSNAAQLGIKLNLQAKPINQITETSLANCVVAKISCDWDFAAWGGGTFSPDYLPTGDVYFLTGAATNSGGYSNAENDALIEKTLTSGNMSYMYAWEDYLSAQLPQLWQAAPAFQLTEVANDLKGALPQSSTLSINPENWYFVK